MTDDLPTTETHVPPTAAEAPVPPPEPTPAPAAEPEAQAPPPDAEVIAEAPANGAAPPEDDGMTATAASLALAPGAAAPPAAGEEPPAEEPAPPAEAEEPTAETPEEPAEEQEEPAAEQPVEEPPPAPPPEPSRKHWYVVKVQSGREESIKEAIERRVKIEGLEEYFGKIIIPVEKYTEMRNSKRVQRTRKLYPGYLMVEVEYNDRILYLFRETSGVGDFVGGGVNRAPPPMPPREVESMLASQEEMRPDKIKPTRPKFDRGDRVRVKDGTFAGMEGEVKELLEARNLVRVELTIFGRPVPVELEYWQVELV